MEDYKPSSYFTWSVHLDGMKEEHDKAVCQDGVFDRCVSAIKKAKSLGFRCNVNCTIFDNVKEDSLKEFLNYVHQNSKLMALQFLQVLLMKEHQINNIL